MSKRLVVSLLAVVCGIGSLSAASGGSCESKAVSISVGKSKSVTLVQEYDPEFKEYYEDGVAYFSSTISKGKSYTFYIEGGDVENISLDAYPRYETDAELEKDIYAPMATFTTEEYAGVKAAYLFAEDWDAEDQSKWKYYFVLSGDVNASTTLHFVEGIQTFVEPGTEDNPLRISVGNAQASLSKAFTDSGDYYMATTLTAGRKYRFRVAGGSAGNPYALDIASDGLDYDVEPDPEFASDPYNTAVFVTAHETGVYTLSVTGGGSSFSFHYQSIPARAIAAHPVEVIGLGGSTVFVPGRMNATLEYSDEIVDERLFRIALAAGERCVFETMGADRPIRMVAYDAKGSMIGACSTIGGGSYDVRLGLAAGTKGNYYVGVYNPALTPTNAVVGAAVTMTVSSAVSQKGVPDAFDDEDDDIAGANALSPLPSGSVLVNPVTEGCSHGPHQLGRTDWADVFVIGGRKDVTYKLALSWASAQTTDLHLLAEAYSVAGKKETVLATATMAPGEGELSFTAKQNTSYYVRFTVAEGKALDYPPYNVHAAAYSDVGNLYSLTVNTKGAAGTWSLGKETVKYPGGSSVLVVGDQTVKFYQVKGFSTPAVQSVSVVPGEISKSITGIYSDMYDPKDDTVAGASRLNITAKSLSAPRTLYIEDLADHFLFQAKEGYYYDFGLDARKGDPLITVFRKGAEGAVLAGPDTAIREFSPGKGDFIVRVAHSAMPEDSSYSLTARSTNVGAVKFAKTAIQGKMDTGYVDVSVLRTAKEGCVRVEFATCAGTAQPGVDYYPQTNVLTWASGDNKAKPVRIRLIPDTLGQKNTKSGLTFSVKLRPYSGARGENEYLAAISTPEAVVTLSGPNKVTVAKQVKAATVKTETVPLRSGTFYGVVAADAAALSGGFAALGSVTVTVQAKAADDAAADALSAKVMVAGKTYQFKTAKGEAPWDGTDGSGRLYKTLRLSHKIGRESVTSTLRLAVADGSSAGEDWLRAPDDPNVELVLNVQDAKGSGYQPNVRYVGSIYRQNAKIQSYLDKAYSFNGYYTLALVPRALRRADGSVAAPGAVPEGNGYLTITADAKGGAKVAGLLADGTTLSVSAPSCAIIRRTDSSNGMALVVPVFFAKSSACFGGEIVLFGKDGEMIADASVPLVWNSDNAAATVDGAQGWEADLGVVGGRYDTVKNLQAYYWREAFTVATPTVEGYVTAVQPNGTVVNLYNDTLSVDKRVLVKSAADKKLNDFANSVNVANVQVKLVRATGLVSGSFSLWTEGLDSKGTVVQKETTGIQHRGVLVLSRDTENAGSLLSANVWSAGTATRQISVLDAAGRSRRVKVSSPFNIICETVWPDSGDPLWREIDNWGGR